MEGVDDAETLASHLSSEAGQDMLKREIVDDSAYLDLLNISPDEADGRADMLVERMAACFEEISGKDSARKRDAAVLAAEVAMQGQSKLMMATTSFVRYDEDLYNMLRYKLEAGTGDISVDDEVLGPL